ncbi:hypothetical protein WJX74_003566 [Apatococcus lobatus]|uniref:Anaphase-promoting complex subunit 10 n=1 Tax=Apatococcus lobatus TaxID=904363 RepID=A0AAW1S5H5_9CHLO
MASKTGLPASGPDSHEIGKLAVWTVTSAKPGNGVELLRDDRDDTYWQSDGMQPHLINIHFQKKVRLTALGLLLDYKLDESYTPNKVAVRAGATFHDLKEIKCIDLEEPAGWTIVALQPPNHSGDLKACFVQLAILSNHQNGRDTHVRQIKIFGPRQDITKLAGKRLGYSSLDFQQHAVVRPCRAESIVHV